MYILSFVSTQNNQCKKIAISIQIKKDKIKLIPVILDRIKANPTVPNISIIAKSNSLIE
jgi:hypothetical protein